jgi:LysR family transcriptional regulator, carnitine catabolism transcriptional activator
MNGLDLNFRHLQAFITVARLNSFTRAAKVLNLSQPALTKQVGQLEETLGIRLFDRDTRTVVLTQIGKEISPVISQLLREVEGVLFDAREVAAKNRGIVRVAALPSLCSTILPTSLARFREIHPGISVALRDVVAERVLSLVRAEEVDFGVGTMLGKDTDVRFSKLLTDRMVAGLPAGHPLEQRKTVTLRQLVRYPLVLMAAGSSVRTLLDEAFASIGQLIKPAYEATYMSTTAAMVQAGLGVTILPSSAMKELTGLVTRPISQPAITRELGILDKAGRSLSPAAESFLRTINTVVEEMS